MHLGQLDTKDEILATDDDYVELESLAEDMKNIKEDKQQHICMIS